MRTRVLVSAALLCATVTGCGSSAPTASTTTTTPAATTASAAETTAASEVATPTGAATPAASGNDVLGPNGWGPVTLGQDPEDAAATGVFTDMPEVTDICVEWYAAGASPLESVIISPTMGIVAIVGRVDAVLRTPEGMKFGSTAAEVHAMYPEFAVADAQFPNGRVIAAPGGSDSAYRLRFSDDDVLQTLMLESSMQDCYG